MRLTNSKRNLINNSGYYSLMRPVFVLDSACWSCGGIFCCRRKEYTQWADFSARVLLEYWKWFYF